MPFFGTLALGGLLAALVYSASMAALTRERHFLYFCIALCGEIVRQTAHGSLLPGYLGLLTQAVRAEQAALGALIATLGFVGFFYTLVPGLRTQRVLFAVFASLVMATLLALGVALLWGVAAAAQAGNALVYELLLVGFCMTGVAWRQGQRHAGVLMVCVGLLWLPEFLRLASALGLLPALEVEYFHAVWSVLLVIPVLLVGLSRQARGVQALLDVEQAENQSKLELLTRMSHELRTPLDTILGNAQLLERRARDAYAVEGLQHIQHSGRHLLHMVDEVLDYARCLAGKLPPRPEPVDWGVWVRQVEHSGQVLAGQRNNSFAMALEGVTEHRLILDVHRLQQVLDNLIANAVRHTHGGWIRLDCSQTAGWLHFGVSDNGEGIAPQDLERIFLPFERGSHASRNEGRSVGMGLAIARQLVRSMGGELTVQSSPGKGTRFAFAVQTQADENQAHSVPTATPAFLGWHYRGPARTVLVVDSSQESRSILGSLLRSTGFHVLEASGAVDALRVLHDALPVDLAITDLRLSDGNAGLLLQSASKLKPPVPVILVSAEAVLRHMRSDVRFAYAAELQKPVDHAVLLQAVTSAIGLQWGCNTATELHAPMHLQRNVADASPFPPTSELQVLTGFIASGQVSEILQWASALQLAHPEYAPFVQAVSEAARDVDFPALRALAEEH